MKLNDATDIRIGTTQASKVYMGSVQIWPSTPIVPPNYFKTKVYLSGGTVTLSIPSNIPTTVLSSISYSMDNGATWITTNNVDNQAVVVNTPGVANSNDYIYWKGNGIATSLDDGSAYCVFSCSDYYDVEGDIRTLLYGDVMPDVNTRFSQKYTFYRLFYDSAELRKADQLSMPTMLLSSSCYHGMFMGCDGMTTAPALPATTLEVSCYNRMFYHCTSLVTAPVLPATTMQNSCYYAMFYECTSLASAPALPATTLAPYCYCAMFSFTNITSAPVLPAPTLVNNCYDGMFNTCQYLNFVKCLATSGFDTTNCTRYWLSSVSATGTFVFAQGYGNYWQSGTSGIPVGWTRTDTDPRI